MVAPVDEGVVRGCQAKYRTAVHRPGGVPAQHHNETLSIYK